VQASGIDWDQKLKSTSYTGGQLIPAQSEFKQVLKRRKSRLSTEVPSVIDFEYQGNVTAAVYEKLIGKHNRQQLNFELNLR
jgi:hypothetical protein